MKETMNTKPEIVIDAEKLAAKALETQTVLDSRIARSAFSAALKLVEEIDGECVKPAIIIADEWNFREALAAVYNVGKAHGIREERAKNAKRKSASMTELKYKRRTMKLSQEELAEKAGIDASIIRSIEDSSIKTIKAGDLLKLAAALGCDADQIV